MNDLHNRTLNKRVSQRTAGEAGLALSLRAGKG